MNLALLAEFVSTAEDDRFGPRLLLYTVTVNGQAWQNQVYNFAFQADALRFASDMLADGCTAERSSTFVWCDYNSAAPDPGPP